MKQAQRDWEGAFAALDEMVALTRNVMPTAPLHGREYARVALAAARPPRKGGALGAQPGLNAQQDIPMPLRVDLADCLPRLLIAQNKTSRSRRFAATVDRPRQKTASTGTSHLTAQLLHAVVLEAQEQVTRGAADGGAACCKQAEPEGYVRLFVDAGLPVARLLYQAIEHDLAPDYARRLLAAFPQTDWSPQPERNRAH